MRRIGRIAASMASAGLLLVGVASPTAAQEAGPDEAEVALVFDFSSSILDDPTSRNQFGAALEEIADRVEETQNDLIKGDTTVSIVQFASQAADTERCTEMKLLGSPSTVRRFANCLRSVASAYRAGGDPSLTGQIGDDTNYVAAMEQAASTSPRRRDPADDGLLLRREARRRRGAGQRGRAGTRPVVRGTLAVRAAPGRDGPRPGPARRARVRPGQPPDRPGRAGVLERRAARRGRASCSTRPRRQATPSPSPCRTPPARSRPRRSLRPSRRRPASGPSS